MNRECSPDCCKCFSAVHWAAADFLAEFPCLFYCDCPKDVEGITLMQEG